MKRFLTTSFVVLALVVGATGTAPATHAQTQTFDDGSSIQTFDDGSTLVTDSTGGTAATNATSDPAAERTPSPLGDSPKIDGVLAKVMNWIMSLFAWLLGVAAITLDNAVYYTVVTMGTYVNNLAAVDVTWKILRDIGNIMLIFGFLAVGVTTILNVDWYGGGKKMLPMMLVAAVFLNFSLFISEAFIDTGNLFATQFYTQINGGNPAGAKNFDRVSVSNEGISNKIMDQLGLATIYAAARTNEKVLPEGTSVFIAFMSIILFLIAAFVMFSLAFVLISRFVILLFLIILSPVAFAGLAIPQMARRAGQWWDKLFEQIVTAPILLLMLYVALAIITDANFLGFGPRGDWTGFVPGVGGVTNFTGFAGIMLSFFVAMGLLLAVVIQSKNLAAFGASLARKGAAALTFGATAYGASALFGGSAFLARKGLQRVAPNSRAVRAVSNYVLRPLERAKFDVRSAGIGAALGAVGIEEASKSVGASTVGRGKQGIEWTQHMGEKANQDYDKETRIPRLRQAISEHDDVTVGRLIGRMSDTELEGHAVADLFAHDQAAAANLPQNRFDKLMQSDKLSDNLKETIRRNRGTGIENRFDNGIHLDPRFGGRRTVDVTLNGAPAGPGGVPPRIPALSSAQRAELPSNVLTFPHVMDMLTPSDFVAIARRAALEPANQRDMGHYLNGLALADPRLVQIEALARTNRSFAAYFGIP